MSIYIRNTSLNGSTLERYSMIAHLLSKLNSGDDDSDNLEKLRNIEEIKCAFDELFTSLQNNDPASYSQITEKISDSIPNFDSSVIQSINIKYLDYLVESIGVFSSNEDCLYMTLLCISELLIIEDFRRYFFSKSIFQISLDAFYSDSEKIPFYALKIICAMIEFILTNKIQFDIDKLLEKLEIEIHKTLKHEYFVVSILRSIVDYSDFSSYYEKIIDILCSITLDQTTEANLNEVGEIIYTILQKNFNYFYHIYGRTGIIGILIEQLNENTIQTYDIHFPIPILRIVLCVIDHLKDSALNKAIHFAKSISYDKYEELIRNSVIELSELALEVISFLLKYDKENFINFERVMANFIAEAPFVKKHLGILFFLSATEVIDLNNLDLLLNLNIIENCSFCLDSDDCCVLNKYLMIILNLLNLSLKQESKVFFRKIYDDILKIDLFNRAYQVIDFCTVKQEYEEIAHKNLDQIDEIIQNSRL